MASETVDMDQPSERPKFGENLKVYRRRNRKKAPENKTIAENVAFSANADTHAYEEIGNKNATDVTISTSSATFGNNNSDKEINEVSGVVPHKSPQTLATKEANLSIQANHAEVTVPNNSVRANGNAAKAIFTKVEDRIRINLENGRPMNEIRELKRKFSNELDQVRSVVKRLEDKEISLPASTPNGAQYSMNDRRALTRVYSDVGSVVQQNSKPNRLLSVSIMENHAGFDDVAAREKRTPKANQYYQNSEFLLAKDRLPPEVSNKRWKPYGVKKNGKHAGYKSNVDKFVSKSFKGCVELLSRLMKHKYGWVFNKPVDVEALNLQDYHVIIKNPMDLGSIKDRLSKHLYKSPNEFAEDVKLTFNNAMTYNPKGHEVHGMAEELLKIFEAKWTAIEADYNLALRYEMVQDMGIPTSASRSYDMSLSTTTSRLGDMGLPTPTSKISDYRNLEIFKSRPPVLRKPKAKDPYKRDMTYDEKQKLSSNLQNLPPEKLNDIVQIIKKSNSSLSQRDDEIEVDIDSVDAETLWELDRFVLNFKKNLSKKKRRAEIAALKAGSGATHPVSTIGPAPTISRSQEYSHIGEKGNANPSRDQEKREGDDAGKSSSSSSSSSGSGSSSSDTDSDSSSDGSARRGVA